MLGTELEQIQDLLQDSIFLQRTFEAIFDGILVVDRVGSIIYVNPRAESLLGLEWKDLVGKKAKELPLWMYSLEGDEILGKSRPFADAWYKNGEGRIRQVILKRSDGSTIPILFNINKMEGGRK